MTALLERLRQVLNKCPPGPPDPNCPGCCGTLTRAELDALGRLDWTPQMRAVVRAHAGELARTIRTVIGEGQVDLCDVVGWIHADGTRPFKIMRRLAVRRMIDTPTMPQAAQWVELLSKPAPAGRFTLFVSDDSTSALFEHTDLARFDAGLVALA